jgi:Bacterial Ig-like domain (group 2)
MAVYTVTYIVPGYLLWGLGPILLVAFLTSCGDVPTTVYQVEVTPSTQALVAASQQTATFVATGIFGYRTSRPLEASDGLSWTSSNTSVAGISMGGTASCKAAGEVTVTATVPVHVVPGTNPTVSGTAKLTCM